jgi:hypothetical protein
LKAKQRNHNGAGGINKLLSRLRRPVAMNHIQKVSLHLVCRNPGWPSLIAGAPALNQLGDRKFAYSNLARTSQKLRVRTKE